jgi:hypothetical protein
MPRDEVQEHHSHKLVLAQPLAIWISPNKFEDKSRRRMSSVAPASARSAGSQINRLP